MSRDATGIYSAWAVQSSPCLVCGAKKGEACNTARIYRDGPLCDEDLVEWSTHWQRTENAPPYNPNPEWAEAVGLLYLALGRAENEMLTGEELERVEPMAEALRAIKAGGAQTAPSSGEARGPGGDSPVGGVTLLGGTETLAGAEGPVNTEAGVAGWRGEKCWGAVRRAPAGHLECRAGCGDVDIEFGPVMRRKP